ncbi:MAG: 2-isopropylmalate synthase, partial [Candidatus Altiarchaeales archaeon]|nr:2-isopropylmalate synthase [Candidatus Altiarchaeales archaeon]
DILKSVGRLVEYCKKHGVTVDLCTEDGSRTDVSYLKQVLAAGRDAGCDRFTLADTVGVLTPSSTLQLFREMQNKTPLGVHCHDDHGLATANTLAAVEGGARIVDVTVNGLGERAGNAPLEEVAVGLKTLLKMKTGLRMDKILEVSKLVEEYSNVPVPPNKAVVGENAFTHEAGIHVDGILKKPETYEPIKPELVGAKRRFVLGKHVGFKAVKKLVAEEGLKMTDQQLKEVYAQIKYLGDKGKRVTSVDLESIALSVLGEKKQKALRMEELVAIAGNRFTPTASVKVNLGGKEIVSSGVGTGPVDAAIAALRAATKDVPFELAEYHVDSVSGGTDAVVRILVKLKSREKIVTAEGAGADIVLASVDAMVNGLNTILNHDKK